MSVKKYKPGPWIFNPHNKGQYFGNIIGSYGTNKEGIETIRTITVQLKHGHPEENLANANLIAAAPELLEALEPFANFACDEWETHGCYNCIAKRAIAKAHGEIK